MSLTLLKSYFHHHMMNYYLYNVKVKGREKNLTASSSEKITAKWINWSGQLQGNETRG